MNPTSVDLSILGAFPGNYRQELFTALYNQLSAINDFTFWSGVKNTEKMTKLNVNGTAKPYTGIFAPMANDLQYTGQDLTVQAFQRDLQIMPSQYRQAWMAYNRGRGEGTNNQKIPFADFLWQTVFGNLAAGINDKSIYFGIGTGGFGVYNPATAYTVGSKIAFTKANGEVGYYNVKTATTAGQTPETNKDKFEDWSLQAIMVGFGAIIQACLTAGKMNQFVTGVLDAAADSYQVQKELFRHVGQAVQDSTEKVTIFQSYTDYWLLMDSYEDKVSKYTERDASGITYLAGTDQKCIIKPVTSMAGSRRLIATRKSNMIVATDEISDFNSVNIVPHVYHLEAGISGVIGAQIKDPSEVVVSDQS